MANTPSLKVSSREGDIYPRGLGLRDMRLAAKFSRLWSAD